MTLQTGRTANNAESSLLIGIGSGDTTITLRAGEGALFPACSSIAQSYLLTLKKYNTMGLYVKQEIVKVTNRTVDSLTIVRSQGTCVQDETSNPKVSGTTAYAFDIGDTVSLYLTSEFTESLVTEINNKLNTVDYQNGTTVYGSTSSGTDAYAITLSPALPAYVLGQCFKFQADVANTGPCTLNINGLGAKTIKKLHDQDTATGDIEAGQIVEVAYDGTNFQMNSQVAIIPVIDIHTLAEKTTPLLGDDEFMVYDTSDSSSKRIKDRNIYKGALVDNTFQAGEAITAGQCVYLKSADSKLYLTDSDAAGTSELYGISTESVSSGAYPIITIQGMNKNQTGLTAGANYYLSGTPGAISTTAGTNSVRVGYGLTTTSIMIDKGVAFASDVKMVSRTTGLAAAGASYTKHREYVFKLSGTIRVTTTAYVAGGGSQSTIYVKVYKNGSAVGAEHTLTSYGASGSRDDDITVSSGNLVQVYTYGYNNGTCNLTGVYLKYTVGILPSQGVSIT